MFENWDWTLNVRKTCPGLTIFGSSLRFLHKDFIALFRIVFPVTFFPSEDVGILSPARKPNCNANNHRGTRSKATYFWSPNHPSAKKLSTSVFHTCQVACGWLPLPYSTSNCFHQDFKISRESLMMFSFNKFTVEPFALRGCRMLRWKDVELQVCALRHFSFLRRKGGRSTPFRFLYSFFKICGRFTCHILLSVLYFPILGQR